jgi:MFS family permease
VSITSLRAPPARIVLLVGVLCASYMISQFLRSSTGVIAPELAQELNLAPQSLGVLSGAFFFAFAAAQIPAGLMLDRYGARISMSLLISFAIAGALLFASANSLLALSIARALMGLGCSCLLIGPLMIYTRWFPRGRFATMSGIQIAAGTFGGIFATAPLGFIAHWAGWRMVFFYTAAFTAIMGVLVWLVARDSPPGDDAVSGGGLGRQARGEASESLWRSFLGLGEVLRNPSLPHLLMVQFVGLGSAASVLGLWASPFLHDAYGLDGPERGNVLLVLAVSTAAGMLFWGQMDLRFDSRKKPVLAGAGGSMAMLGLLAFLRQPDLAVVTLIFAGLGFCNGYAAVAIAHGRAIFPDHLTGRGIALLNMGGMAGAGVMQYVCGVIVGLFAAPGTPAPPAAYHALFGFLMLSMGLALLFYTRVRDARPSCDGQISPP